MRRHRLCLWWGSQPFRASEAHLHGQGNGRSYILAFVEFCVRDFASTLFDDAFNQDKRRIYTIIGCLVWAELTLVLAFLRELNKSRVKMRHRFCVMKLNVNVLLSLVICYFDKDVPSVLAVDGALDKVDQYLLQPNLVSD